MGEETNKVGADEVGAGEGSTCRNCGIGCLGLGLLGLLTFGGFTLSAASRLDTRFAEAAEQVLAKQQASTGQRATILGAPANEDNAVVDYNGLEWAFSEGDPAQRRASWKKARPPLPDDIDAVVAKVSPGEPFDAVSASYPVEAYLPPMYGGADRRPSEANLKKGLATYERAKPALRYVRQGVTRGRCDWGLDYELGMRVQIPNLLHTRAAANLLAYEATLQPPQEALETGLVIVAYGQDIGRQGTLISSMVSIAVQAIGYRSLAHTLSREGLGREDYLRVVNALKDLSPPALAEEAFQAELLAGVITQLEASGRPMSEEKIPEDEFGLGLPPGLGLDVLSARELEGYEYFMNRFLEIAALPRSERKGVEETLVAELEDSTYLVARIALPNLGALRDHLDESLGLCRALRACAAAHVVRLDTGSFPSSLEALKDLLGEEGLQDPTALKPGPLRFRSGGDQFAVWVVGDNGADDQGVGPQGSDDRGIIAYLPGKAPAGGAAPPKPKRKKKKK